MTRESSRNPLRKLLLVFLFPTLLVAGLFALPTPEASEEPASEKATAETTASEEASGTFALVGARLFDGEKTWPTADVLVEDGRVRAVAESLDLPADTVTVDAAGHTLLPGFVDAHVHAWGPARVDSARFGVTTLLDHFTATTELDAARDDRDAGGATDRADLFSAGTLATVEGGHGTQYGMEIPTLDGPESAAAWVKDRKAEGSDWIKIIIEGGSKNRPLPTLDFATVEAIVDTAHAEGLLAVAHATTLDDALEAVRRGVDGLVHVWQDRVPTEGEVNVFREAGIFLVPTLVVMEGMVDASPSLALAEGPFASRVTAAQRSGLEQSFPYREMKMQVLFDSVQRLHEAGVPILAGSDAPNPATAMGLSMHREMALLVDAGLEAEEALAAATSAPARAFRVPDRGRVAEGLLADLVLVEGDPTRDIAATTRLVHVWKAGQPIGLDPPASTAGEDAPDETLFADFEDGLESRFGSGWAETTDARMGGKSSVELTVEDGALVVSGAVKAGTMFPWAGAIGFVGGAGMQSVDFSSRKELVFRVRGDSRSYMVMAFAGEMQGIPPSQPFEVGEEWREVVLPLEGFAGADLSRLRAFSWNAVGAPGAFRFEIDDVEIR